MSNTVSPDNEPTLEVLAPDVEIVSAATSYTGLTPLASFTDTGTSNDSPRR